MSRPSKSCQTLPRKLTGLQFLAIGAAPASTRIVAPVMISVASNPVIVRFKIGYCFCINLSFFISPELSCERWPYLRLCSSPVAWNDAARRREPDIRAYSPLHQATRERAASDSAGLFSEDTMPAKRLPLTFRPRADV